VTNGPLAAAAVAVVVGAAWLLPSPSAAVSDGPSVVPDGGGDWRELLDAATAAAHSTPYEASVIMVTLDTSGPGVTELSLRRDDDGRLVSASATWLVARDHDGAMVRHDDGLSVRVGQVPSLPFMASELERNYQVAVVGRAHLETGPTRVMTFERHGVLRERLFVDDDTHLVVRRETYARDGRPVRVMVLTDLAVAPVHLEPMDDAAHEMMSRRTRMAPDQLAALEGHGWSIPITVGDGFELRAGFAVDDGDAVQLVYSDGLYTVSVFEQPGSLASDALTGSVREVHRGMPVYRWPGAQPLRVVWNGGGHTFTAVTDAPIGDLVDVVADLPHTEEPGMLARLARGLKRMLTWAWPFD